MERPSESGISAAMAALHSSTEQSVSAHLRWPVGQLAGCLETAVTPQPERYVNDEPQSLDLARMEWVQPWEEPVKQTANDGAFWESTLERDKADDP